MSTAGPCPGPEEIERLAGGGDVSDQGRAHLERCAACRARVDEARGDASFLNRVRTLTGRSLAPEGAPRLAGYRVQSVLSAGSQGVVYRGVQESTSRAVAIKVLMAGEAATARQRFRAEREAEIAARLRHPNIVTVFESRSLADGRIAVVMEFVDGVPLDRWVGPGQTPAERQRSLVRACVSVCNAIHHAHLNGVIHRDLKPDNIMVTHEGRPVVLDFGIAKAGGIAATLTGEFAGTPAYASPEQARGRPEDVDALTDVYSLGVILYRALCGAPPYELDGSIFEIARTIAEVEPIPPRLRNPAVPADLEAIVLRAMRKDKGQRYQSAAGLARDLERYLNGDPVDARSGSGWYLLRKAVAVNRRRLALAGAAVVLVAGAAGAVVVSLASVAEAKRHAEQQREQAQIEGVRARAVTELMRAALPPSDPSNPELARIVGMGLGQLYYRLESGGFADDPDVDQAVRRLWGQVYTGLGSGKAASFIEYAEDSLRNGLVRLRREHGAEHADIAATMHDLAGVMLVRERLPEAESTCRDAMLMRERILGPRSAAAAESRALLARIMLAQGRAGGAVAEAEAALRVLRTLPERESDLSIAAMCALCGRVRLEEGDGAESEPLLREAIERRLRRLPPDDPDVLSSLKDCADLAVAEPGRDLSRVVLDAWECEPGAVAGAVKADISVLGLPDRGGHRQPVTTVRCPALGRVLRLQERLLGRDDPSLVGVLTAQLRAAEGEQLLNVRGDAAIRAAEILERRFGRNDLSVLMYIEQAASVLAFTDRIDEAARLGRRACEIWDSVPDVAQDRLLVANTRRRYGWYLALAGRPGEAVPELRRCMEDIRAVVGAEHRSFALAESTLAYCLIETGQPEEAEAAALRALRLAERLPATPEDQLAHIRFVRGHILRILGRPAEARDVLARAWDVNLRFGGPPFPWWHTCMEDLALCCESMGDTAGAAEWRARLPSGSDAGPGR